MDVILEQLYVPLKYVIIRF